MKQETKRELKPRLRFPEFQDAPGWEIKPLANIAENLDNKRIPVTESDRVKGNIPYYGASGIIDYINDFIFDEDLLCLSEDGANLIARTSPIAFSVSGKSWVNNHAHVLRFENTFTQKIIEDYLNSIKLDDFLTGMAQPKLNRAMLDIIPIPLPEINEQQKIADCLASIDELTAAQIEKLDMLKVHKKGLMQQLFPAEGETVPRLRFPEFRDAPEWKEDDLSKLSSCDLSNGVFNDPKKVGSGYKLINVSDMYIDTVINEDNLSLVELSRDEFLRNKVESGDLFFTRSSLVKSGIAYSNIYLGNSNNITFDGHLIRFRPNKKIVIPVFVNYLLRTSKVRSQLVARGKTATMTTIGQDDVENVKLSFPHLDEQQRIANCLSSIDDRIAAQTQKIAMLKAHKKGLMQQLFPSPDEVKE